MKYNYKICRVGKKSCGEGTNKYGKGPFGLGVLDLLSKKTHFIGFPR